MNLIPVDVKIHPTVLFSIIDSYERRNEKMTRVVGSLLGTNIQGNIEVTDSFVVPHRDGDEVALDVEFAKNSMNAFKKINPSVSIVGWFSTGNDIPNTSCLIHEYYARETISPIHLTVDTNLKNNQPDVKAYYSTELGIPERKQGTIFVPIPIDIISYDSEKLTIDLLQDGKFSNKRIIKPGMDFVNLKLTLDDIYLMLNSITEYVDKVLAGKIAMDSNIGRHLVKIIDSIPLLDPQTFDTLMTNQMNDLLMVQYLSNLVQVQLTLNEKLSLI
ncbi:eukaryotic translation initiation factor 3 subunit F-like [Brachionus plicatilis]|uniref:Eukaryotic translation initiation factor 3 subunit F n=1 Tax=Brachionus plicatilis TaxID=10195 RepID=A0A3M7RNT0_BRAPC|nr:eukaryotic translation initiation factor 3 subunit F-like [Brachionus plicatilis]